MTKNQPLGVYRNATIVSESPNKRFALVEVGDTSYLAIKSASADLKKGDLVVVEFFTEGHLSIL